MRQRATSGHSTVVRIPSRNSAAAALILFTILANHFFHHFWAMEGMQRTIHFYFFCNNIAVIGGLLLVMAS